MVKRPLMLKPKKSKSPSKSFLKSPVFGKLTQGATKLGAKVLETGSLKGDDLADIAIGAATESLATTKFGKSIQGSELGQSIKSAGIEVLSTKK